MLFPLGSIVSTPGAMSILMTCGFSASHYLDRHASGDWGDLCDDDKAVNDAAVTSEGRILSAYETFSGEIWVITEWNRSVTTLLLPSEY